MVNYGKIMKNPHDLPSFRHKGCINIGYTDNWMVNFPRPSLLTQTQEGAPKF